jgi:hypothetical protein
MLLKTDDGLLPLSQPGGNVGAKSLDISGQCIEPHISK